jgi:hypothetical protein
MSIQITVLLFLGYFMIVILKKIVLFMALLSLGMFLYINSDYFFESIKINWSSYGHRTIDWCDWGRFMCIWDGIDTVCIVQQNHCKSI